MNRIALWCCLGFPTSTLPHLGSEYSFPFRNYPSPIGVRYWWDYPSKFQIPSTELIDGHGIQARPTRLFPVGDQNVLPQKMAPWHKHDFGVIILINRRQGRSSESSL